ncbi:hypothetical protein, partial [Klebsiella pneumoniae]|uniref:hypothetical protein n=1 Tax=Klebsiella pneumoniae TaxID=573 RepID=UPI001F00A4E8
MSSPTFLGERPKGPILGASEEVAPTSPPVHLMYTTLISLGSNLGGMVYQMMFSSVRLELVRVSDEPGFGTTEKR